MRRAAALLFLTLAPFAPACINDRDTVASEMRNAPEEAKSLVGWFDRYPARYYEMRVSRLRAKPSLTLNEYDDLAAALDRLGRSDEAVKVMDAKAKRKPQGEDLYRLHANRGTFLIHGWLHNGAKPGELAQAKRAEKDIAAAVRIKPGAHFGRESTQLETIRWMIATQTKQVPEGLGLWLSEHETEDQRMGRVPDHARGLSGLISLGAAWESVDVAAALVYLCNDNRQFQLADFARFRVVELQKNGKKPYYAFGVKQDLELAKQATEDPGITPSGGNPYEPYLNLRAASDKRSEALTAYVNTRLETGSHPDTDSTFWKEWKEPEIPKIPEPYNETRARMNATTWTAGLILLAGIASLSALCVWLVKWRKRRMLANP